eukprot:NODE_838_length_2739_cov_16.018760.p1 GENE.NODE_838_length_2739_cov_16.018760~~NODE_838_length_2739_cov_16.018760.p1  ORF type:complete len:803 (-),score=138.03 NODE_838_length_2739_cov_16.018760:331-2493(-)
MLLLIDAIVTITHIWLPIRWCILWPSEVIAMACYVLPVAIFGSWHAPPAVVLQISTLATLVFFSSVGKRALESHTRAMFKTVANERTLRCLVEAQLDKLKSSKPGNMNDEDVSSLATSGSTAALFSGLTANTPATVAHRCLLQIAELGLREHWLLNAAELQFPQEPLLLGAGGFGIVMPAVMHGLVVAVKVPRASQHSIKFENLHSIANELRILRRVRHPNIVMLYGALIDPTGGEIGLVVELVTGMQLQAFIVDSQPPVSADVRHSLLLQICCALQYLHMQQPAIVHGDLKATNIVVERTGLPGSSTSPRVKLLDFGLSRIVTRGAKPLGGTKAWMAPELFLNRSCHPHVSSDVFSFGCLLFHVLTGLVPVKVGTRADLAKILRRVGSVPMPIWPVGCAYHDEGRELCARLQDLDPLQRPPMHVVHGIMLAWRPEGLTADIVLDPHPRPFSHTAIRQVRQKLPPLEKKTGNGRPRPLNEASIGLSAPGMLASASDTTPPHKTSPMGLAPAALPVAVAAAPVCATARGMGAATGIAPSGSSGSSSADGAGESSSGNGDGDGDRDGNRDNSLPFHVKMFENDGSIGKTLQVPKFLPTPDSMKDVSVLDALHTWNCSKVEGRQSCCDLHGIALSELGLVLSRLQQMSCMENFTPHQTWQCPNCRLVDNPGEKDRRFTCLMCGYSEDRRYYRRRLAKMTTHLSTCHEQVQPTCDDLPVESPSL